jgi:hypothetical protein
LLKGIPKGDYTLVHNNKLDDPCASFTGGGIKYLIWLGPSLPIKVTHSQGTFILNESHTCCGREREGERDRLHLGLDLNRNEDEGN